MYTKLYTPKELADYLRVNRNTIYRYLRAKRFTAIKMGTKIRIPSESVEEFLKKGEIL